MHWSCTLLEVQLKFKLQQKKINHLFLFLLKVIKAMNPFTFLCHFMELLPFSVELHRIQTCFLEKTLQNCKMKYMLTSS